MQFNAEKFRSPYYLYAKLNVTTFKYTGPKGITIPEAQSVRDLGIDIIIVASFHGHITNLSMKCRRMTGWILRTFRTKGQETIMVLW